MIKKISSCVLLACAVMALGSTSAYAQRTAPVFGTTDDGLVHTVNFTLGGFSLRGEDGRDDLDILIANREFPQFLVFDVEDFSGVTIGGEYLVTVRDYIEVGGGIGYWSKSVPGLHDRLLDSDGSEIDQDLDVRVVPITFTARYLPLGRSPIQPYVGGGLGIFPWRYRESGEFVEFDGTDCTADDADCPIFEGEFETSGTAVGPVILGGLRFAGDGFSVGGEIRWHRAVGEFPDEDVDDFFGTEIDLGGTTFQFTVGVRF